MTVPVVVDAQGVSVAVRLPHQRHPLNVVDKASLKVYAGGSHAIIGRSGAGKTSLLSVLGLLNAKYDGRVLFDDVDVSTLSDRAAAKLRALQIGYVFQSYSLMSYLSALENVLVPCVNAGLRRAVALPRAKQVLADVGLADRCDAMPNQLSGGEQQRVAIARALVNRPRLVLADEPTGALDTDTGAAVMSLLIDLVRQAEVALVVVTHDDEVARLCAQRHFMDRGRLWDDKADVVYQAKRANDTSESVR